jgi:hypothetical protein
VQRPQTKNSSLTAAIFDERKNRASKSPVRPVKYKHAKTYIFTG